MKRRALLWGVVVILAIAVAIAYLRFRAGETPAGQRPLATIHGESLEAFRADFNASAGGARLIVLLSPT